MIPRALERGTDMPYKSKAQRAYLHIHEPEIAKRWDKEYPNQKNLPKHVKPKKKTKKKKGKSSLKSKILGKLKKK